LRPVTNSKKRKASGRPRASSQADHQCHRNQENEGRWHGANRYREGTQNQLRIRLSSASPDGPFNRASRLGPGGNFCTLAAFIGRTQLSWASNVRSRPKGGFSVWVRSDQALFGQQ
jgi:hypothetical protein